MGGKRWLMVVLRLWSCWSVKGLLPQRPAGRRNQQTSVTVKVRGRRMGHFVAVRLHEKMTIISFGQRDSVSRKLRWHINDVQQTVKEPSHHRLHDSLPLTKRESHHLPLDVNVTCGATPSIFNEGGTFRLFGMRMWPKSMPNAWHQMLSQSMSKTVKSPGSVSTKVFES